MFTLFVSSASVAVEEKEIITAGRVGLQCSIRFSPDWDGLVKTAVFDGAESRDVIVTGERVTIPAECLAAAGDCLKAGFYGKSTDGAVVIPTVWASLGMIEHSVYPSGREGAAPTPDVVAQIQQAAANAEKMARSVREDADLGKFNGGKGEKGEKGDRGNTGPAGEAGGFYTPAVTQPDANTMRVAFSPSKEDMPDVEPMDITLPSGGSGSVAVDSTLTASGKAADAKATGDAIRSLSEEIANINTDGISATARNLLITILRNGVYSSDQKANITDLETALGGSDAPVVKSYAITNNLTNCTTNNAVTSVTDGDSYTATLTAADGYALNSVVVTMGGTDITSTAYSGSVITIASVTGDVSIVATAVAAESGGGETVVNLFDKSTMVVSGAFVGANGAISTSATSKYAKIPISVGTYALQKGSGWAMSTTGHPSLIDSAGNVLCKFGNLQANGNAGSPSDASIGTIAKANGNAGIAVTVLSEAVTHIIFSICVNGGTDDTDTTMMEVGDTCHDYVAHV